MWRLILVVGFFVLTMFAGCASVDRVVRDVQSAQVDSVLVSQAQDQSTKVGDLAGLAAQLSGLPTPASIMVDKVSTTVSCFLFLWYGGYKKRKGGA